MQSNSASRSLESPVNPHPVLVKLAPVSWQPWTPWGKVPVEHLVAGEVERGSEDGGGWKVRIVEGSNRVVGRPKGKAYLKGHQVKRTFARGLVQAAQDLPDSLCW